jgi:hypothetical protein
MMKPRVIVWTVLCMLGVFFAVAYSQEDMTVVSNESFAHPQRVSAVFKHDKHNEAAGIEECNECHHIYKDGVRVEDESSEGTPCSECHAQAASGNTPALMAAFHANCKGCHLSQKKGPVMCGECHVR